MTADKRNAMLLNTLLIVGVTIGTSISGWALNNTAEIRKELGDQDSRLEYIERTRYTAEDAIRATAIQAEAIRGDLKELGSDVGEIKTDIAVIKIQMTVVGE